MEELCVNFGQRDLYSVPEMEMMIKQLTEAAEACKGTINTERAMTGQMLDIRGGLDSCFKPEHWGGPDVRDRAGSQMEADIHGIKVENPEIINSETILPQAIVGVSAIYGLMAKLTRDGNKRIGCRKLPKCADKQVRP